MADHSSADSVRLNRLADEISPYLLLHKTNPVDWYPWGDEAIARARDENKPIFLSVGYATCFWCHVMERESFADADTAALMNEAFINIKLDREERPELDEIYMTATQLLTGQGGWPNSVFLTPDLKPFYAGTYFPPKGRHGLPGFRDVLDGLAKAWQERRNDVQMQADEMEQAIDRYLSERGAPVSLLPPAEVATRAVERLSRRFDAEHGGFGGAPKFPSPSNLYLLDALAEDDDEAARMLDESL
ncbi:MAG: thioredoxin domain-containing protein, partial [Acidobacteriota bacterium]